MTPKELIQYQLESTAKQLHAVLDDFHRTTFHDVIADSTLMSAAQTVSHLTETYIAVQEHFEGKQHEWGSYKSETNDPIELMDKMWAEREKAVAAVLSCDDEGDATKTATEYIIMHDPYHVGELVTLRLHFEPNWDAYSIYSH